MEAAIVPHVHPLEPNFRLLRAFHVAIYFNEKCSELCKYVAVGVEKCCRRIEDIGAVLSGDIF